MQEKIGLGLVLAWLVLNVVKISEQSPRRNLIGELATQKKKVDKAAKYFLQYGYLGIDFDVDQATEEKIEPNIKTFQRYANVKVTGKLDDATIKRMSDPRCGMRDPLAKLKIRRSKRWTLQGQKWDFKDNPGRVLTWKLVNSARNIPFQTVRKIISTALGKWSAVAEINFKETTSDSADLIVKFVRRRHGDAYTFDGPGGTLAHAFYPYPGYAISGDMHFDDDEEFTAGKKYGTDLLWVATHEAGHSLGLEHSNVQDAVMYPWYQGGSGEFKLRYDDIIGIQTLYGARERTTAPKTKATKPTTAKPTTEKPTTEATTTEKVTTAEPTPEPTQPQTKPTKKTKKYSKDCPRGVSASMIDPSTGWMFLFYGENFYLTSRHGLKYGPIKVSSYFKKLTKPVTAAYVRKSDNHVILFTGNTYNDYYNFRLVSGSRPVSDFGLPSTANVDAAFYWKGNGRLYIFSGTQYYKYNDDTRALFRYYPRTISRAWRGLPSRVTAAVTSFKSRGKLGPTYFVSNDKFYEFNDKKVRIHTGYPKHIKSWLLCNSDEQDPLIYPGVGSLEAYSVPADP